MDVDVITIVPFFWYLNMFVQGRLNFIEPYLRGFVAGFLHQTAGMKVQCPFYQESGSDPREGEAGGSGG